MPNAFMEGINSHPHWCDESTGYCEQEIWFSRKAEATYAVCDSITARLTVKEKSPTSTDKLADPLATAAPDYAEPRDFWKIWNYHMVWPLSKFVNFGGTSKMLKVYF
uniref:Uncharacterized protein n=1 Tax=Photinus pyralis TaxID=7054 RepID=A0A1Y1MKX4_PHOPY